MQVVERLDLFDVLLALEGSLPTSLLLRSGARHESARWVVGLRLGGQG